MNYLETKKKAIASFANKIKGFLRNSIGVPPISLESCADDNVINYKLHGNSYQATRSGKNLLDINKAINERQESTLTSAAQYYPIQLKPNTSYTLTTNCYTDTLASIFINLPNVVSTTADNGVYAEATYRTVTTDDTGILWIWTRIIDDGIAILDTSEFDNGTYWAQLEQGTTPTAYEQYGASPSPDYPSEVQSVGERIVPDEYQRVEYIEGSGTQYIDTLYTPNKNTKIAYNVTIIRTNIGFETGARIGYQNNVFCSMVYGNNKARFLFSNNAFVDVDIDTSENHTYEMHGDGTYYIDNKLKLTLSGTFDLNYNVYIFRFNQTNTPTGGGIGKLYMYKIWDNDVLVRNFIPCYRKSDNVIGMYDNVNDVFYTNQGSGAFLKGPDIGNYKIPVTARSKNYCNPIITGGVNANGKHSIDNKGIVSWKRTNVNSSGGVMLKTFLKAGTYDFTIKIFNVSGYSPNNSSVLYLNNNLKFANGSSVSYGKSTLVVSEDCYISFNVYSMEPNSERIIGNSCSWSIMITDNGVSGDDYEPYHEPITTNIYLDEPLRKVGDYADYIDFKNSVVVRNISKYPLVMPYPGAVYTKGTNTVMLSFYHGGQGGFVENSKILCPIFKNIQNAWYMDLETIHNHNTLSLNYYCGLAWSRLNLIYDGTKAYRSDDETQTELTNKQITDIATAYLRTISEEYRVVYAIPTTPTQTSISLPILPTFKGISTVYEVETTIQPSNMEAEYYSNKKS